MAENTNNYETLDDIVFKTRNREYGAFYLRSKYKKYAVIAFLISFVLVGTIVAYPVVQAYYNKNRLAKKMEKSVVMEMEKLDENLPPPPPPPPPPAEVEAQTRVTKLVVKDTVKEEVVLATVDEQKEDVSNVAPPDEIKIEEKKDEVVEEEEPELYFVEEPASFQGGDVNTFRAWVQSNMIYPTAAQEAGISGKITVQFAVNSKGKVVDAKIIRGVHPELDKEAIRGILASPPWTPGKQGGRAVKQVFVIPIIFQLQ
jgi:protein TonB